MESAHTRSLAWALMRPAMPDLDQIRGGEMGAELSFKGPHRPARAIQGPHRGGCTTCTSPNPLSPAEQGFSCVPTLLKSEAAQDLARATP